MACKYKYKNNWYSEEEVLNLLRKENTSFTTLYNNLIKELETSETGRRVFEQVKRDYVYKESLQNEKKLDRLWEENGKYYFFDEYAGQFGEDGKIEITKEKYEELTQPRKYTLEEQQEEAIVQIIGLYSAQKLDKLKDKTLIQLIKELLKEMSDFVKLIFKKEINIAKDLDNISELTDTELNKLLKNGEITKKCE